MIVRTVVTVALVALLLATGPLADRWQVEVKTPDGGVFTVDSAVLRDLREYAGEDGRLPWSRCSGRPGTGPWSS